MIGSSGAGWSSLAARRAHNPKVVGSNPAPATNRFLAAEVLLPVWAALLFKNTQPIGVGTLVGVLGSFGLWFGSDSELGC